MNRKCTVMVSFLLGAITGFALAMKYAEDKYAKIADEEIASVKERYGPALVVTDDGDVELNSRYRIVDELGYTGDVEDRIDEVVDDEDPVDPYVIPYENYGTVSSYMNMVLLYYTDGVVTYETGDTIEDVEHLIGTEWKDTVDENFICIDGILQGSICVRNEILETDYEIIPENDSFKKRSEPKQEGGDSSE